MSKHVEFEVSNLDLACELLEKAGLKNESDFICNSQDNDSETGNSIKLFSNLDKKAEFNKLFVENDIDVERLSLMEETLESYFTDLIR